MSTDTDHGQSEPQDGKTGSVLRIEHRVNDYAAWRAAFDADPLGRERSGVIGYRVMRASDDLQTVMIDLEFGSIVEAEAMGSRLRSMWAGPASALVRDPRARVVELVAWTRG